MSPALVRRLADVRLTDAAEVGGKAASLGELLASGIRVPDGVVLPPGMSDLTADDRRSVIREVTEQLGSGPYAVRSSGIAEDGVSQSYAGMYDSELDVFPDDIPAAADRILASANGARAAHYERPSGDHMAVIIQRMVRPSAAGVVLTADPINGDRGSCVVTAVRGTADRLVSGAAVGDEWTVRGEVAMAGRLAEGAIDRRQALRVAGEARRIASTRRMPQDIEWAIDGDGSLWIVQARPMTALPPDVSWEPSAPGAYTRTLRFGEWISRPVTPLFESWLLTAMEDELHASLKRWIGQWAPRPYHVVVNGWYFYSINWLSGRALVRSVPTILRQLVRSPRRVAGVIPPTVRHSVPVFERDWRDDLQPRYRAAVSRVEDQVASLPVAELPALIDELAKLAGEYFASIAALAGAAYKMEMNLAIFYRRHLGRSATATCRCSPDSSPPPIRPGMPSPPSTGGSDPRHPARRRQRLPPTMPASSPRGMRPRRRPSGPWHRHRGACAAFSACWLRPSTSSRFAKSRSVS